MTKSTHVVTNAPQWGSIECFRNNLIWRKRVPSGWISVGRIFLVSQEMSVGVSQLAVVASIGGDKSSNPVIAPGIGLGLSVTLSKVVVTSKGGVWAVDTAVGETVAQIGIGLGLGVTLSKVVVTSKGGVWAVDTAVGETVAQIGIGLG